MRITELKTWKVAVTPGINWVFVRLSTDEGLHGWGEATLEGKDESALGALRDLERSLVGDEVPSPEAAWRRGFRGAAWKGAALYSAVSAVDHALWDIRGKALGQPVSVLLGGPVRDRIHAYTWAAASERTPTLSESVAEARNDHGFTHFKMAPLGRYFTADSAELATAVDAVAEVNAALPPGGKVAVEGHQRLSASTAIQLASQLRDLKIMFLEDFVNSDDESSMVHFRRHVSLPITAGEKRYSRWDVWPLLRDRLIDFLSIDLCHAGGISESGRIASAAEMVGVSVVPHNPNGPVGMAATLQLAAAHPNIVAIETVHQRFRLMGELSGAAPDIVDGYVRIPDLPGLGVELDVAALEHFAAESEDFPFGQDFDVPTGRI
ncbi:MAG TPA: mandelate racemase/muconate lactonizing enzyme family protein [Pseudolysinimonas sp.]|nr:mandelate racemase/muconate lactonizing enzyme family protein [Pseudolysinimonas sp.]